MESPARPRVAWISPAEAGAASPLWLSQSVAPYSSVAELLEAPPTDLVVVHGFGERTGSVLLELRAHAHYSLRLIYLNGDHDPLAGALADGACPVDEASLLAAWSQWQERLSLFNRGRAPEQFDQRLLCWLWQRPEAAIQPIRDPSAREVYRYPLVESFTGDSNLSSWSWLQQKQQENLLEGGDLLDRIRQCTSCNSSRLNYVDVCPECHGLDIVRQPSLHCFVCGHVAPQQDFLRGDSLVCPNCLSQLRHIGSDYDRPMENYRCRSCSAFFVDADVDVYCIDCGQRHTPDDLRVREIRPFRLTDAGRLACRQGLDGASVAAQYFRRLKLMNEADFLDALNWQMAIARRYGPPQGASVASVLGMRLDNLDQVMAQAGEVRTTAMLDSLMERLQQVIRDTDRCMRGREDVLWMLLPQTPATGLDRLQERLVEGLERIGSGNGQALRLRFVGCVLPDQLVKDEDGALLLARLAGDLR